MSKQNELKDIELMGQFMDFVTEIGRLSDDEALRVYCKLAPLLRETKARAKARLLDRAAGVSIEDL